MNKMMLRAVAFAALASSATAYAANVGVDAVVGTSGIGAHLSVPLKDNLNARLGFNMASYNFDGTASDVDYDFKLKLNTFDALLDYFPSAGSSFRLTGGAIYNGNKIDAVAKPATGATYRFNGRTYSTATAGQVEGKIDFRKVAPYLGIGWGNAAKKEAGWGFTSDLGIMFSGKPTSDLRSTNCTALAAVCNQLAADVAAQNRELNDELDKLKFYPVVRIGVTYKF